MRAAPLIVLASTVVAAVLLRAKHPVPQGSSPPRASLAASPAVRADSLPSASVAPADKPVARAGPHMLHGDAHHSHRAHGRVGPKPDVLWTFHADGPIEGQVVTSPDDATLYVATLGGALWALDRSGHPRFHVALGARVYATPCVGPDGIVYVGTDGGAFFAVGATGAVLWKLETSGDADTAAVLLEDGVIAFAAGADVYGLRAGATLGFRFRAKGKVFTAPVIAAATTGETRIVVGSQDHRVYALSSRGDLDWATDLGHDVDGAPVVDDDGAIYVGTDGGEVVRLARDGHVEWRLPVGGQVRGTLSVARNGDVLAGVYGPSPRIVRISSGGILLGAFPVRGNGNPETGVYGGALEDDDGTLVFGGQDGLVHVVDASGIERWTYDARADVDAPVTLLPDGTLVVADYAGDVIAFGNGASVDAARRAEAPREPPTQGPTGPR